jgi:hypothetical protein
MNPRRPKVPWHGTNFYPKLKPWNAMVKYWQMRNMRGMQLAQRSVTKLARAMALSNNGMVSFQVQVWEFFLRSLGSPRKWREKHNKKNTTKNVGAPKSGLSTPLPLHKNKSSMAFGWELGRSWLGHLHVDSKRTFHEDKIIIVYWTKGWSWWVKNAHEFFQSK